MSANEGTTERAKVRFDTLCQGLNRVTELAEKAPSRKRKSTRRRIKRKELLEAARKAGEDVGRLIPCVMALIQKIYAGEPIGFSGRKKVVGELLLAGKDQDFICRIFLASPAFREKYEGKLIVNDNRPESNPCGWRLSPGWRTDFEPSCDDVADYCNLEACYRSEQFLIKATGPSPTFEEFQRSGMEKLQKVLDSDGK